MLQSPRLTNLLYRRSATYPANQAMIGSHCSEFGDQSFCIASDCERRLADRGPEEGLSVWHRDNDLRRKNIVLKLFSLRR
jgi:hypothetical protein